jgi:hypothetical protein
MFDVSGILIGFAIFTFALVYANLFEYVMHRWLMHRLRGFVKRNHMLHHSVFRGDRRYRVLQSEDRDFILFEWWQGPVIVGGHLPALWIIGLWIGWPVIWPTALALAAYFAAYEYLHWCMHNPVGRVLERTALFRYLDGNHKLHHGQPRINFNVVCPLADALFGTLRRPVLARRSELPVTSAS